MAGHAWACAGVGASNAPSNQSRTLGENWASGSTAHSVRAAVGADLTVSDMFDRPAIAHSPGRDLGPLRADPGDESERECGDGGDGDARSHGRGYRSSRGAAARSRARRSTSSIIAGVSLPVNVFCWEG